MPSSSFGTCCNPFRLENHKKNKSLRQASKYIQAKWGLTRQNYLCDKCRKKLTCSGTVSQQVIITTNGDDKNLDDVGDENDMIENVNMFDYVNVDEIDEINPIPSTTSASQTGGEIFSQFHTLSESNIDNQLVVINRALALLNVSPIPTRKLIDRMYLNEKVGEVCRTLKGLLKIEDDFSSEVNGRSTNSMTSC